MYYICIYIYIYNINIYVYVRALPARALRAGPDGGGAAHGVGPC